MTEHGNRSPVPPLTDDERRAALDKAMRVRAERAQLKRDLKRGLVTARQALIMADGGMECAAGMRTDKFMAALPGFGAARAEKAMRAIGLSPSRRLRGIGPRQREALLSYIEEREGL